MYVQGVAKAATISTVYMGAPGPQPPHAISILSGVSSSLIS